VLCHEKTRLADFLAETGGVFQEYEEIIEEECKVMDFITRYEDSVFFKLESMIMTPAEERDSYKAERDSFKEERDSFKEERDSYKEKLEQTQHKMDQELETLRKELETLKRNA
jgi:septin family protein